MKKWKWLVGMLLLVVVVAVVPPITADAATYGDLTYTVSNGEVAITDCSSYASGDLVIPDTIEGYPVTSIGYRAFYNCNMTSVTIPDSVTDIGNSAFEYCDSLTKVYITDLSAWCNISFGDGSSNPLTYANALYLNGKLITNLVIPNGVKTIGAYAFRGCDSLTSVTIPDSVTSIGRDAFAYCYDLTSVTIGNGVTSIGRDAFYNCDSLTSVTIGDSVTSIGYLAFYNCQINKLIIAEGSKTVNSTMVVCKGTLKEVVIPNSVKTIGNSAFSSCYSLTKVYITDLSAWCNISFGDGSSNPLTYANALYLNGKLITNLVIPNGVKTIGAYAFRGCDSLTSVTIPDSVTSIGRDAFAYCYDLTSVTIPGSVKTIGDSAFEYCDSLTSVTIGNGVTRIGYKAFYKCTSLAVMTLPFIGGSEVENRFLGYIFGAEDDYQNDDYVPKSLATVIISEGCTSIGEDAFYKCSGITDVFFPKSLKRSSSGAFSSCDRLFDVWYAGSEADKNNLDISYSTYLYNAQWHYGAVYENNHIYDNACDTTCNICAAKRTIVHRYAAATCTNPKKCTICGATYGKALGHTYKTATTKATLSKNGSIVKKCAVCGNVASTTTISYPKTVKLYATSYTYNGKAKTPTVIVKDAAGKTLKKGTDYTVTYASGRKNVGTYKVTVKMKGNYTGTKTLTFKITPVKIAKCTVKLYATSYTYNGKAKTPTVIAKDAAGKTLKKGTDYTVTYAKGRKNVGTYKVTVKMKGNYSGTKVLTFKIVPKAASINKLTAKSKAFTVKLNRVTTQSTGYQIQYSTSSKFTSAKTVNVTSYKTSSKTISKLKKGKKYYVRVRTYKTVGKTKFYSAWSSYKSVKTK